MPFLPFATPASRAPEPLRLFPTSKSQGGTSLPPPVWVCAGPGSHLQRPERHRGIVAAHQHQLPRMPVRQLLQAHNGSTPRPPLPHLQAERHREQRSLWLWWAQGALHAFGGEYSLQTAGEGRR